MKPLEFMDTSCKGHTKPFCIISIYIKIWNYFFPGAFSSFSSLAQKSEEALTKESEEN